MALDVELYRRTVYLPTTKHNGQAPRRISVIDIAPEGATHTMVLVHGYGGNALQWIYQLHAFGQFVRVIAPDLRGHGLSDDLHGLPYTMDDLVDDLGYVLDALQVQRMDRQPALIGLARPGHHSEAQLIHPRRGRCCRRPTR